MVRFSVRNFVKQWQPSLAVLTLISLWVTSTKISLRLHSTGCVTAAAYPHAENFLSRWASLPGRRQRLQEASANGLFKIEDRSGDILSEEELMWNQQYGPDGSYEFWSLGYPKKELVHLTNILRFPDDGLSVVVLGCGLGVEVDHIACKAQTASSPGGTRLVAGVDFALTAVESARGSFGDTPGVTFYHADVCDLPSPSAPLDLIIDNTVFQNVHGSEGEDKYMEALRRLSLPGHTVLHLNLMSLEGIEGHPEFNSCMEYLNLPLMGKDAIFDAFSTDWTIIDVREGLYDLKPEGAGFECDAFYSFGGKDTPGIPSWWILLLRK